MILKSHFFLAKSQTSTSHLPYFAYSFILPHKSTLYYVLLYIQPHTKKTCTIPVLQELVSAKLLPQPRYCPPFISFPREKIETTGKKELHLNLCSLSTI